MNHDFDVLVINIHGVCTKCKHNVSFSRPVTRADFSMFNVRPFAALQAEDAYEQIDNHPCSKEDTEQISLPGIDP